MPSPAIASLKTYGPETVSVLGLSERDCIVLRDDHSGVNHDVCGLELSKLIAVMFASSSAK